MILQILRNLYFVSLCVIRLRFHELKSKLYKLEVRSSENGEVSRKMACDNNLKSYSGSDFAGCSPDTRLRKIIVENSVTNSSTVSALVHHIYTPFPMKQNPNFYLKIVRNPNKFLRAKHYQFSLSSASQNNHIL